MAKKTKSTLLLAFSEKFRLILFFNKELFFFSLTIAVNNLHGKSKSWLSIVLSSFHIILKVVRKKHSLLCSLRKVFKSLLFFP